MIALTPLDGSEPTVKKVLQTMFDAGVIAFFNGSNPTRLRFLPPVPAMSDAHVDAACAVLEESLAKVANNAGVTPASSKPA
jgi:acetylornithine aminotransferase